MKTAAVDVDGVLLDCNAAFAAAASDYTGRQLVELNTCYELDKRYGISNDDVLAVFEYMKTHPQGWAGMPALAGAIEAMHVLRAHGYAIHLVTAISEDLKDMRLECLRAHDFVPDGIHCAGHHLASKTSIIRALNPVVMIDDRLRHLYESEGVPTRVWIDHGDEQDGLAPDDRVVRVNSLSAWIAQEFGSSLRPPSF